MSKFSGKSDFADTVEMYGIDNILRANIRIGSVPFKPTCENDLIPFYPNIISSMSSHKNEDGTFDLSISLCRDSYVDEMERERLFWMVRDCIECAKALKYNKKFKPLNFADLRKYTLASDQTTCEKVLSVFNKHPDLAKINFDVPYDLIEKQLEGVVKHIFYGIRVPICTAYRKELLKYAMEKGCEIEHSPLWDLKWKIDNA